MVTHGCHMHMERPDPKCVHIYALIANTHTRYMYIQAAINIVTLLTVTDMNKEK